MHISILKKVVFKRKKYCLLNEKVSIKKKYYISDFGQAKFRCLTGFSPTKYFAHGLKNICIKSENFHTILFYFILEGH